MPEKTRRPDPDPQAAQNSPQRRQQPGAGKSRKAPDQSAEANRKKLQDNQRQLEVGTDHKTPAMKKGHRGTYP
jgi:hypothetical protein